MSVAHDAASNVASGTTERSWTHTPVGTPAGVIVLVGQYNNTSDGVTGVTYGGVAMTEAVDYTTANGHRVWGFFLGDGIPTGAQTVVVSISGSITRRAAAFTVTAATAGTEVRQTQGGSIGFYAPPEDVDLDLSPQSGDCSYAVGVNTQGDYPQYIGATTGYLEWDAGSNIFEWLRSSGTTRPSIHVDVLDSFYYCGLVVKEANPAMPRPLVSTAAVQRASGW